MNETGRRGGRKGPSGSTAATAVTAASSNVPRLPSGARLLTQAWWNRAPTALTGLGV